MQSSEKGLKDNLKGCSPTKLKDYDLLIYQPKDGYRFSVDALLLANFSRIKKNSKIIELGSGCGVVSLILSRLSHDCHITAVEIQRDLYNLLEKNIKVNDITNILPLFFDIKKLAQRFTSGTFDHVVSNPPFRRVESGRLCLDSQEALARHEILLSLKELIEMSRYLLRPGGKLSLIYPAERMAELVTIMSLKKIEPKRLRFVHPNDKRPARLVLVEGVRDAGQETQIETPLFINQ